MLVTILGSSEDYIDLKNYLIFPNLELVCTEETNFDKMVLSYANQKNISRLQLKSDKGNCKKCVVSDVKQTMIDISDVVLLFFDKKNKHFDAYVDYCNQQSKEYRIISKKHIKTA